MTLPNITTRQHSTILAALRLWQHEIISKGGVPAEFHDIATDAGSLEALSVNNIDILIERLQ